MHSCDPTPTANSYDHRPSFHEALEDVGADTLTPKASHGSPVQSQEAFGVWVFCRNIVSRRFDNTTIDKLEKFFGCPLGAVI